MALAIRVDTSEVWKQALGELRLQIRPADFQTWFREASLLDYDGSRCVVATPNPFAMEWLNQKCRGLVGRSLTSVLGQPVDVEFVVQPNPTSHQASPELALEIPPAESRPRRGGQRAMPTAPPPTVSPRFTFSSFVVGPSNRLAHAACIAVAERPGELHNPLFIYGGVGLGKTHLLHSIGTAALARDRNVVYISAETFVNEFITSITRGRMEEFRGRYRQADFLLVDDIQFLAGKEQTQEEFFHTFNVIYGDSRQIVLTSDRHPRSLATLTRRLQSRFAGGLIADIQEPELETRIAILQTKWEMRRGLGVAAPLDVLAFLAEGASNGRELEGALNRVRAYADLLCLPWSVEVARQALDGKPETARDRTLNPSQILKAVARATGVGLRELQGPRRDRQTALARQVAAYLLREHTQLSLSEIGGLLGGRDHSTVAHSHEKVAAGLAADQRLRQLVSTLRDEIGESA